MTKTQDALQRAKDALLQALRTAESESVAPTVLRALEKLTGQAETLQWKLEAKRK